jgi:hypothetical protein
MSSNNNKRKAPSAGPKKDDSKIVEKKRRPLDASTSFATGSSEEPDVVVIVGGTEFHEYRQVLRCMCGYFDGAFRSGMKESVTKTFEFPDKDPNEWKLLMSVMAPGASNVTQLTRDNIDIILRWSDELCISHLPQVCDMIYGNEIFSGQETLDLKDLEDLQGIKKRTSARKWLPKLLDGFGTSQKFGLETTKSRIASALKCILNGAPELFTLTTMTALVSLLHKQNLDGSLDFAIEFLSERLDIDVKNHFDNPFLPELLWCRMQLAFKDDLDKIYDEIPVHLAGFESAFRRGKSFGTKKQKEWLSDMRLERNLDRIQKVVRRIKDLKKE